MWSYETPIVSPSLGMPVSLFVPGRTSFMFSNELDISAGCSDSLWISVLLCSTIWSEFRHHDSASVPPFVLFRSVLRVANPIDQWPHWASFTSKYDFDWTNGAEPKAPPDPQHREPFFKITTSWPVKFRYKWKKKTHQSITSSKIDKFQFKVFVCAQCTHICCIQLNVILIQFHSNVWIARCPTVQKFQATQHFPVWFFLRYLRLNFFSTFT